MEQTKAEGKSRIISDASFYTGCVYLAQLISFIGGLAYRDILGPTLIGIWGLIQIYLTYSIMVEFGVLSGSEKEIPYFYGKGEREKAHSIRNFLFSWVLLVSLIAGITLAIYSIFFSSHVSKELQVGILFLSFLCPLQLFVNSFTVLLRSNKRFKLLGITQVMFSLVFAGLSILLSLYLSVYGIYTALVISLALNIVFWFALTRNTEEFNIKWNLNRTGLVHISSIGFPMLINSVLGIVFITLDSLVVGNFIGAAALGYYGIAVSLNKYIYNVPNAFSVIMFPRFQEKYGQTQDKKQLYDYIRLPTIALAFFVLPLLIGIGYFFGPFLIRQVLPRFEPGIPVMKILLAGTFFISLTHMPGQFLYTIYKQKEATVFGLTSLSVLVISIFITMHLNLGIEGVAFATSLSYFISLLALMYYALSFLSNIGNRLLMIFKIILAFAYTMGCLRLVDSVMEIYKMSLLYDFLYTGLKFAIYAVLTMPLIYYAQSQIKLIERLRGKL